ncbi:MAG: hypothetical protein K8H75_18615 [Sulfuricella sp.]|nr:hypothetical protein [Sulfuricella sp.]
MDNLEAFRQFYREYPRLISETAPRNLSLPTISETASRKSTGTESAGPWQPGTLNPNLVPHDAVASNATLGVLVNRFAVQYLPLDQQG